MSWSDVSTEYFAMTTAPLPDWVAAPRDAMSATSAAAEGNDEGRWARLMVSAQAGNEVDYRMLLSELAPAVAAYLRARFGHHDFVEDCVQEVLLAVHEARHTYQANRLFRPWLFSIVRHKAIDALRQQRRRQTLLEREWREQVATASVPGSTSHENTISSGRMIASLDEPYRDAITLTKIVGLSSAEAAAELHISEGALKVRVHRAIGRLKKLLEADRL